LRTGPKNLDSRRGTCGVSFGPDADHGEADEGLGLAHVSLVVAHWSMTTLRNRLVKIGAKIVRHGRSITFQKAEVMVPRQLLQKILAAIAARRPLPLARC